MSPAPSVLVAHKPLNKQAQLVLQYMIERGGITRREAMDLGILNLPARVLDIRTSFGPESIKTEMVSVDGSAEFAVWKFTGALVQGSLAL